MGALWWRSDAREFRRNLRAGAWPDAATAVRIEGTQRILHLTLGAKDLSNNPSLPLIRDHGKLLHVFLIREPALDAFAHVHPERVGGRDFDLALPDLPEGDYKLLVDLTLGNAVSTTAATMVHLPASSSSSSSSSSSAPPPPLTPDPDDSFAVTPSESIPSPTTTDSIFKFPDGMQAIWKSHAPLHLRHDAGLVFEVRDAAGQPVPLEPYMGMLSHAAVLRRDGAVFSHLHPTGNYSMAAQWAFETKVARETAGPGADATPPEMDHSKMHHDAPAGEAVSSFALPYEFPSAGDYRIWVQFKTAGRVLTAVFDATVAM